MNVSVDPMTDPGRRAGCGYRCDAKAATRDSENARSRYACSDSADVHAVVTAFVLAATRGLVCAGSSGRNRFLRDGQRALVAANIKSRPLRGLQTRIHAWAHRKVVCESMIATVRRTGASVVEFVALTAGSGCGRSQEPDAWGVQPRSLLPALVPTS